MSTTQDYDSRTIKGKKAASRPPPSFNPSPSGPSTFFLRSEKDLDKDLEKGTQRGRAASRGTMESQEETLKTPPGSIMADSSFGVESLADTINSTFTSSDRSSLSRTNSAESTGVAASDDGNVFNGRKRKAGNPVHPKIVATGQRIISSEYQPSTSASPRSLRSAESPFRSHSHLRRGSATSSINLNSQPLTPLKMSPQPNSAMPSTPRSASPKSFRLSDEECSVADETGSQAVQSSSGDDDEVELETSHESSMPQLVMPSISMPTRRPFTERGKRMGRLKVMVIGQSGTGKTSLIQSFCRVCEDVVHVDPAVRSPLDSSRQRGGVTSIMETHASTRTYPSWWAELESRRSSSRRKSSGDGVLERNLCFIDTPGVNDERMATTILEYLHNTIERTMNLERMHDSEVINVLGGDGSVQIDAVLWLFDPSAPSNPDVLLEGKQKLLFESLCKCTNVVPLVARADELHTETMEASKERIQSAIWDLGVETYSFAALTRSQLESSQKNQLPTTPFAVSSALSDDTETIDASILMSSQYLQPLVPSELDYLVTNLLDPDNIARMRHLSATKVLLWRQAHMGRPQQNMLHSPQFGHTLPSVTSTGSLLDEPSKVLLPPSSASYYRSLSPSLSDRSSNIPMTATSTSTQALAQYNEQNNGTTLPFRQVRLAKWAQDLQRSLDNERKRYREIYLGNKLSPWTSAADEGADESASASVNEKALISHNQHETHRPARGRLGGAIAVIDPRDPLGLLAFGQSVRRRGWFALRVAGGCGLVGAVAWWVVRNWAEVQEWWYGPAGSSGFSVQQLPPWPVQPKGALGYLDDFDWKGFFGWER